MTRDEMKEVELNERHRSNVAQENIGRQRNKIEMISAIVGAASKFIPGTSFKFSRYLGGKQQDGKDK